MSVHVLSSAEQYGICTIVSMLERAGASPQTIDQTVVALLKAKMRRIAARLEDTVGHRLPKQWCDALAGDPACN